MAYDSTKPAPNTKISAGRPTIQGNFAAIEDYNTRDHVSFDANSPTSGKHKKTTFVEQVGDPIVAGDEIALYSKETTTGAVIESTLYIRKESNGTVIQLTGPQDPVAAQPGQTYLPGGMIMKWGSGHISSAVGGSTVTFSTAFPNNCFTVQAIAHEGSNGHTISLIPGTLTTTGFDARGNNTIDIYYVAIGN